MGKINVGHIGWLSWDESPECETVAWCDINADSLRRQAQAHPGLATYTDYRDMLKHPGLDAVVISTPNYVHAEQAIAFLQAGKHVFLEKPMGVNRQECDAIFLAARKSGKMLTVDFEMRASLFARRIKQLIDGGDYGQLRRMEFIHHRGAWLKEGNGAWRVQPEKSGGLYFMEPIHEVDIMRFFGGEIRSVQSTAGPNVLPHYQFEDNVCSHFYFDSGILGTILTSHTHSAIYTDEKHMESLGHDMNMIFTLTKGSIGVDFIQGRILINRFEEYPAGSGGLRVVFDRAEDHSAAGGEVFHDIAAMRREFLRRVAHGLAPIQELLDIWKTHRVCLAAEQCLSEDSRRAEVDYSLPE